MQVDCLCLVLRIQVAGQLSKMVSWLLGNVPSLIKALLSFVLGLHLFEFKGCITAIVQDPWQLRDKAGTEVVIVLRVIHNLKLLFQQQRSLIRVPRFELYFRAVWFA